MHPPADTRPGQDPSADPDGATVAIGPLAAEALEATDWSGEGLASVLERAVYFYLGADRERPGWAYPKLLAVDDGRGTAEVSLPRDLWQRLGTEAERQDVEPAALVQHVALFFAAARDGDPA